MRRSIHEICDNLAKRRKFVNYWAVLFADVILSVASTYIMLSLISGFIINIPNITAISILISSAIVSFFCLLSTENK